MLCHWIQSQYFEAKQLKCPRRILLGHSDPWRSGHYIAWKHQDLITHGWSIISKKNGILILGKWKT